MRYAVCLVCTLGLVGPLAAQDQGLTARTDALSSPRLQARFELDQPLLRLRMAQPLTGTVGSPDLMAAIQTLRLLGDYQFSTLRLGDTGGLRLTGGVLLNLRPAGALGAFSDSAGAPLAGSGYAGVGYSSGSMRADGGWGVSADLGFTALGFGNSRLGGATLDAASREIRLQPMIRLGVNMAF